MPTINTNKLVDILRKEIGYNEPNKKIFTREARKVLKAIAERLGLEKGEFDIRVNAGGIAGSGEVKLHTDKLYLTISQGSCGRLTAQMFRSCNGRKDYSGGSNNWVDASKLLDDNVIAQFERIQNSVSA